MKTKGIERKERKSRRELKRREPDQAAILIGAQLEIISQTENRKRQPADIEPIGGGYLVSGSGRMM